MAFPMYGAASTDLPGTPGKRCHVHIYVCPPQATKLLRALHDNLMMTHECMLMMTTVNTRRMRPIIAWRHGIWRLARSALPTAVRTAARRGRGQAVCALLPLKFKNTLLCDATPARGARGRA